MNLIPGSAEPALQPLQADLRDWLKSIQEAADPHRMRQHIQALPAPRSRIFDPSAMREADQFILRSFQELDWEVERVPFSFDNIQGYLDPADRVGSTKSTLYDHLEGANIVATRQGDVSSDAIVVFAHYDTVKGTPGANDNTATSIITSRQIRSRSWITSAWQQWRLRRAMQLHRQRSSSVKLMAGIEGDSVPFIPKNV